MAESAKPGPTASTERIREELRGVCASGRLHGGYLFAGPSGTGKRETALWFARLLLCQKRAGEPCGSCRDCLLTSPKETAGTSVPAHPDLLWLEPGGTHYRVEQIRELQRALSLVPNEGGWRVAVLLGAELLRAEASNALLKTLEEPPQRTSLILVAEQAQVLPQTVCSRTVRLDFRAQPEAELRRELVAEGFSEEDAWLAAVLGGGSLPAARTWSEANLETARELKQRIEALGGRPASEALDFAETFRGGETARSRALLALRLFAAFARREVENAVERDDRAAIEVWLDRAESAQHARRDMLRRNLNPQLLLEGLLLELVG